MNEYNGRDGNGYQPLPSNKIQIDQFSPSILPGPPNREFKQTIFHGLVETKESIQRNRDYEMFMKGYRFARDAPNGVDMWLD